MFPCVEQTHEFHARSLALLSINDLLCHRTPAIHNRASNGNMAVINGANTLWHTPLCPGTIDEIVWLYIFIDFRNRILAEYLNIAPWQLVYIYISVSRHYFRSRLQGRIRSISELNILNVDSQCNIPRSQSIHLLQELSVTVVMDVTKCVTSIFVADDWCSISLYSYLVKFLMATSASSPDALHYSEVSFSVILPVVTSAPNS